MCIDPNCPAWLRQVLHGLSSMNQVRLAIAEHDMELLRAIDFRRENPLEEDEESESDSIPPLNYGQSQEIIEIPFFPTEPQAGAKVRKFVRSDGWYNGLIDSYIRGTATINVRLENGTEEQWSLTQYKAHSIDAAIKVGDKGFKFVEVFENKSNGEHVPWNGIVHSIRPSDNKRTVKWDDGSTQVRSLQRLQELSEVCVN